MAISSRPALYDHRLPISDRSRIILHRLWEEVVMEVDGHFKDLQEIQLRWRSLRDHFVKEFQSSMAKRSGDEGGTLPRKWRYYTSLLFLRDVIKPRKTITNVPLNEPELSPSTSLSSRASTNTSLSASISTTTSSSCGLTNTKRKRVERQTEASSAALIVEALKENSHIPDASHAFCTRLAAGLRGLPSRARSQLEIRILQLLYEKEEECGLHD